MSLWGRKKRWRLYWQFASDIWKGKLCQTFCRVETQSAEGQHSWRLGSEREQDVLLISPKMDQHLWPTQSEPNAFQNWKSYLLGIYFIDTLMGKLLSPSWKYAILSEIENWFWPSLICPLVPQSNGRHFAQFQPVTAGSKNHQNSGFKTIP